MEGALKFYSEDTSCCFYGLAAGRDSRVREDEVEVLKPDPTVYHEASLPGPSSPFLNELGSTGLSQGVEQRFSPLFGTLDVSCISLNHKKL